MSISDFVQVTVSISQASSPLVANLSTGCLIAYHTTYADRFRLYSSSTMLSQMVTDGFFTTSPLYQMAEAYLAAPNAPAQCGIGRRANPPQQTINLSCIDGTVNDSYDLTVTGYDGKSHSLAYMNVINPGTAASGGTVTTTQNSASITFSTSQTMANGGLLIFSGTGGQPGIYYALSGSVSGTAATLTTTYQGLGGSGETFTYLPPTAGTYDAINGSATVATTTSQVGVIYPGDSVQFVSQLGTYYTVLSVTAAHLVLTQAYSGVTSASTHASVVCTSATAATAIAALINALTNVGTAAVIATPQVQATGLPTNYGELSTIQITQTAGSGNLINISGWASNGFANMLLQDVTADPGIAADLAAILKANSSNWYAGALDSNSQAEVQAAAAWFEATGVGGKVFFWNNSDWQNTQTAVTTDVFSELQADSYVRDFGQQNDQSLLCYAGAATMGQALAMNPGSYTLAYKTLPGVPADSDTTLTEAQAMALNSMTAATPGPGAKNGNYYKTVAGQNWLFPGTAPSGRFFDLTIGIDWLQTRMQAAVAAAIAGLPKLPFTDFGIGAIKDAINGVLNLGSTPQYGLILPNGQDPARPILVTVPTAASLTSAQRASRNVPGISFSAGLQGAIETTTVQGTLIP